MAVKKLKRKYNAKEEKVLLELNNPDNWSPNLTKIAKKLNISTSTIYDIVKRLGVNKK